MSDFLALALSYVAVYFQARPATQQKTFGYQRAGVLAAFLNAATLIVISLWIGVEAVHRLSAPVEVQPRIMMIVAVAGVLMNGVIAALLWGVARDVNMRSAFIHMAGDTLSTAAVIAGGAGILWTHQNLMIHLSVREWEIAGAAAGIAAAGGALWWMLARRRPTADELEQQRRELLVGYGRIVDGILLDHFQIEAEDGRTREMLLYHYEISGVTYECSQDVLSSPKSSTPGASASACPARCATSPAARKTASSSPSAGTASEKPFPPSGLCLPSQSRTSTPSPAKSPPALR